MHPAVQINDCALNSFSYQPLGWGTQSLELRIAGLDFTFLGLNDWQQHTLSERFNRRRGGQILPAANIIETRVHRVAVLLQDPDRYTTNGIYTPVIERVGDTLKIEGHGFVAEVLCAPKFSGSLWVADEKLLVMPLVFENYLRIVTAYLALLQGGLLLHCAGVVADGQAYLFLGRSGAGKTTISRLALAAGAGVLSDDINVLMPAPDGGFFVGAVPFAGELGNSSLIQDGQFPLAGLFWLCQSKQPALDAMAKSAQMAKIYACCPMVNADPQQMDWILAVGAQLLAALPMQLLSFDRDEPFKNIFHRIRNSQHDN